MSLPLEVSGVRVRLGGTEILRGLSFAVHAGEILGIFGPSGAGKSTLFHAISGETPAEGGVSLAGRDVRRWPLWERARAGLGYLPQGPSVLFDLTVLDNLRAFAALARRPLDPHAWARRVGLESRLDVRASSLSGGERRRLELARALLARPAVLLCDEPFAGLNPAAIGAISALLRGVASEGVGVVITDHHLPEALSVAHRALLLLDGRFEVEAPSADFAAHPLVLDRYVGR